MTYTPAQIEKAKKSYNDFMVIRTVESYEPQFIGWNEAEQRCEHHNRLVDDIANGNKDLERHWKFFFLNEQVKTERKNAESKAKLIANKQASADILEPIKTLKKLGEFGKWLNTPTNQFRREHFSKKYTQASVNAFLQTI